MIENKSQLKNGDVVLSSKGSIGIVYKNLSLTGTEWNVIKWVRNKDGDTINKYRTLGMVNDDFTFRYDRDNRITRVWRPIDYRQIGDIDCTMQNGDVIYKYGVKEVTMDEVEAKFGCKVKIKNND